jgi:hypothetical protein
MIKRREATPNRQPNYLEQAMFFGASEILVWLNYLLKHHRDAIALLYRPHVPRRVPVSVAPSRSPLDLGVHSEN